MAGANEVAPPIIEDVHTIDLHRAMVESFVQTSITKYWLKYSY